MFPQWTGKLMSLSRSADAKDKCNTGHIRSYSIIRILTQNAGIMEDIDKISGANSALCLVWKNAS